MFLIVGLGNPGAEYKNTRHNIGFEAINSICERYNIDLIRTKFKGMYGDGKIENQKVILLKPLTYMNLSGESVREYVNFYKVDHNKVIIIYDDISLPVGKMRIREKGSSGGHNGIKSIIYHLNTDEFPRIKVGVGEPKKDAASYVLSKISKDEKLILDKVLHNTVDAVKTIIESGVYESMNRFNGVNIL